MEGQVNIPSKIIEWLSMSHHLGTPNWGASIDGLNKWFLKIWRNTQDNISHDGFKQLKLENIRLAFEQHGRLDLYQALTQYFSDKDQINNIKGNNYISEEAFLNLEDKFKAYISDEEVDMEERDMKEGDMEEECSEMFANQNEKFSHYTDQISAYLGGPYTKGTHEKLKSMLKEIQTSLKICKSKGVNVAKNTKRFNDLNERYNFWRGHVSPFSEQVPKSKSKYKSKSKSKQTRNICSEEENWYRNFNDNIFAIQASLGKPCNDTNQKKVETRINDLKNFIIRCQDDLPEDGIQDRIFTFNELYYDFVKWLNGREITNFKIKPIIAPNTYKCDELRSICVPTGDRDGQPKSECEANCRQRQDTADQIIPDEFYEYVYNESVGESIRELIPGGRLYSELFRITRKPTRKDNVKILKRYFPDLNPAEAQATVIGARLNSALDEYKEAYGAMKKKKSKSKNKSKGKNRKRSGKNRRPSRTRRR